MAVVRDRQGNPQDAQRLFLSAMTEQNTYAPKSAEAATTAEMYAQFLTRQAQPDEAREAAEHASAIRRALGPIPASADVASRFAVFGLGPRDVTAPQLKYKKEPEYTEEARAAKYQGTVVLNVVIGVDGKAHNMTIAHSLGLGLDQKAVEAVSQWTFIPGTKDGQAVPVAASIEVNFRLL
jgi:TonB family protein